MMVFATLISIVNEDFVSLNEELVFDPNQGTLRQCVCIKILDDSTSESDEGFSVEISSSDPVVFQSRRTSVIILDNDNGMFL